MPQGLEVFNEQGLSVFNSADRVVRIIGVIAGTEATPSSGSVTVPLEYFSNNTLFYFLTETAVGLTPLGKALSEARINVSGNTISYSSVPCNIIYGVY